MDLEVSRFRNKMVINVLGEQKRIMKPAKEEGDYFDYQLLLNNKKQQGKMLDKQYFRRGTGGCCHKHGDSRLRESSH